MSFKTIQPKADSSVSRKSQSNIRRIAKPSVSVQTRSLEASSQHSRQSNKKAQP